MELSALQLALLCLLVFAVAVLYSSVGHAGASGYLAAMSLLGVAPGIMKPAALVLNILVASIGTYRFASARAIPLSLLLPFAMGSVPLAFLGGAINLPVSSYRLLLGSVLMFVAFRLAVTIPSREVVKPPPRRWVAFLLGAAIGFVAGLTGVGGGIFLSPLLLFGCWANARATSGASVAFILCNSIAGLLGHVSAVRELPVIILLLAVCAAGGGTLGSRLGAQRFSFRTLRYLLAAVLVVAGMKLILT